MKKITIWAVAMMALVLAPIPALATPASFGSLVGDACDTAGSSDKVCDKDTRNDTVDKTLKNIVDFLFWVVGILAVIMIIWSSIRYATAGGDSNKLTSAKNTLLYSIIGLVVTLLSFGIVNFVMSQISDPPATNPPTGGGGPTSQTPV